MAAVLEDNPLTGADFDAPAHLTAANQLTESDNEDHRHVVGFIVILIDNIKVGPLLVRPYFGRETPFSPDVKVCGFDRSDPNESPRLKPQLTRTQR